MIHSVERQRNIDVPSGIKKIPRYKALLRHYVGGWLELGGLALLLLTLGIAVYSIEQANWIKPQPPLIPVLAFAVLAGWLLARGRLSWFIVHPLGLIFGAGVTIWQTANLLPPDSGSRIGQVLRDLPSWWEAVISAESLTGTTHFAFLLLFFTWTAGFISVSFFFAKAKRLDSDFFGHADIAGEP